MQLRGPVRRSCQVLCRQTALQNLAQPEQPEAMHCMKSMQALASEMQGWAAIKSR